MYNSLNPKDVWNLRGGVTMEIGIKDYENYLHEFYKNFSIDTGLLQFISEI